MTKKNDVGGFVIRTSRVVPSTEWSETFPQAMVDRMHVSYFKYGAVKKAYPDHADALASLLLRVAMYCGLDRFKDAVANCLTANKVTAAGTKNTEYLVDAANFAMIEFIAPSISSAFFEGTDATGSPGRISTSGKQTTRNNASIE